MCPFNKIELNKNGLRLIVRYLVDIPVSSMNFIR